MTLNERCMLTGLVIGGGGGFWEGIVNEHRWHSKGRYGLEPDWFYGLVAMLVFGVIGSAAGAMVAGIADKLLTHRNPGTT